MAVTAPIGSAEAASVPERIFGPDGGRAYRHFLEWSVGYGFAMAILKVTAPRDRAALLAWTQSAVPRVCVVALNEPGRRPTGDLLAEACPAPAEVSALVLTGLEEAPERLWRCAQINVQRDPLAKAFPVPWVVIVHPSAALDLAMYAPDFSDFAGLRLLEEKSEPSVTDPRRSEGLVGMDDPMGFAITLADEFAQAHFALLGRKVTAAAALDKAVYEVAEHSSDTWLLEAAHGAIVLGQHEEAADHLASYDLDHPGARSDNAERIRLEGLLLDRRGQPDTALERFELALGLAADPRLQAHLLGDIARIRSDKGEVEVALALDHERLQVYEGLGDRHARAVALGDIARILRYKGEIDASLALHEEKLKICEDAGYLRSRAVTLGDIARVRADKGEVDAALALHLEQLKIFEELGDRREQALALGYIADLRANKGEADAALTLYEQARKMYEELGDLRSRAVMLGHSARIRADRGEVDAALALHIERLKVYEEFGNRRSRAVVLGDIARMRMEKGEVDDALVLHLEQLKIFEELGDRRERAVTLGDIANIRSDKGAVDAALALHQQALNEYERLGDLYGVANERWAMGRIAVSKDDHQTAREHFTASYAIYQKFGHLAGTSSVGVNLGRLLLATGPKDEAVDLLEHSRDGFLRLGQHQNAQRVQKLLDEAAATS